MKKRIVAGLLTALLAFGAVGCISEPPATDPGDSAGDLEEFSLVLDWYPNGIHSFLYTAMEKGYFAEEGLELKIQFPANTNDGISLPAVGQADAGIYYLRDAIMTSVDADVPVVSIGAVTQTSLNVVIALEESGIKEAKDLVGKKVGYAGTTISEAEIESMLEDAGYSADDCEFVDVGFDLLTALTTKKVDATIGNMANHEVPQLEKEGFDISYFYPKEFGTPDVYELVILTGESTLEENPDKLKAFLRACDRGFRDMQANPEESLQLLLDNQNAENFPLDADVEAQSIEMVLPLMETEGAKFLHQEVSVWQDNADWLYERGVISEPADVSGLVVNLIEE